MTWERPAGASYLSEASPFSMPLAIRRVRCTFAEPLPEARIAHNPTSSLLGAILDRLLSIATKQGISTTWLFKPRSETLKRDFPSPVAWSLEEQTERSLTGLLILWGRHAVQAGNLVWSAIERAGHQGLTFEGESRPFGIEGSPPFVGTCSSWLESLPSPVNGLGITTSAANQEDLSNLCADAAVQLLYWDLADSGLAEAIGRATADRMAESLRREIRHSFCALDQERDVSPRQFESRYSRTNRGAFEVSRWDGQHVVRANTKDDLLAAWPWIALMSLRGPGPRKRFGVSEARVFLPAEVDRLPRLPTR